MKKWWWCICIVDVVIQGAWVLHRISSDKSDVPLSLLAFRRDFVNVTFFKYSKEGRLYASHLGIRNIPSNVCYDNTKYYQVQSEHRRIYKLFKYLRGSVFAQRINNLKSIIRYAKAFHFRCLKGF